MPTTSYGTDITPGDDTGLDDTPICCDDDMTGRDTKNGGRSYTCGTCSTVVTIAASGIVADITP